MSANQFSGPIPSAMASMTGVQIVKVDQNKLSGPRQWQIVSIPVPNLPALPSSIPQGVLCHPHIDILGSPEWTSLDFLGISFLINSHTYILLLIWETDSPRISQHFLGDGLSFRGR